MVCHYATRDFFRQMPNPLLARYFHARGVFADLDIAALPEPQRRCSVAGRRGCGTQGRCRQSGSWVRLPVLRSDNTQCRDPRPRPPRGDPRRRQTVD